MDDMKPEKYGNYYITFKKQSGLFGRGVQGTAWKDNKPKASAGGMSKEEAFEKIKAIIRLNDRS